MNDQEWAQWSDQEISRRCLVDPKTVGKYRSHVESTMEFPESNIRKGADGRTIDTSNIGRRDIFGRKIKEDTGYDIDDGQTIVTDLPDNVDPETGELIRIHNNPDRLPAVMILLRQFE